MIFNNINYIQTILKSGHFKNWKILNSSSSFIHLTRCIPTDPSKIASFQISVNHYNKIVSIKVNLPVTTFYNNGFDSNNYLTCYKQYIFPKLTKYSKITHHMNAISLEFEAIHFQKSDSFPIDLIKSGE